MEQPQLLTTRSGVFVWAFDSAEFEEDSARVAAGVLAWSKMIEQTGVKRAPMFVVALAHDESFASSLQSLESSLRSQLPLPAPTFVLLSHKAAATGASAILKQVCATAAKRRLAFAPVSSAWLALAESLTARHSQEWSVLTLAEFAATAVGFGIDESQTHNVLRFLHENTVSVWWFEDATGLQEHVFCNPCAVVAFCARLAELLRGGVGSDGVLVAASVERLWSRDVREGLRLPFLRLLARLELVVEVGPGKWLVPGALSEVSPTMSPPVSSSPALPYLEYVAREYEFVFVPQHFFHHFCAKAFWFSEATVVSVWKRGMELRLLPQKVGHKEELARVTWDATRYTLKFMIETR